MPSLPPYFDIAPDDAAAETRRAARHGGLRRHRGGLRARARGPGRARALGARREAAAPVLDLGDHPLPDPGGAGALPPRAAPEPRPAAGALGDRGRRQVVHARRGAAAQGALRIAGLQGQALPALPARGAARQDRGGGQLQGRGRQDLDGGAPRHVGGARRLPRARGGPRQPGLDDLDLRRPGRGRVGHGVPAHGAALRAPPARRERAARGPGRPAGAARRDAGRGAQGRGRGPDPAHPLAQHRPDRRAAEPLLGGVPDPRLADAVARLEALGRARGQLGLRRRARRLRRGDPRHAPLARLPDDQRAVGRRHPAGALGRLLPGVRLHGAVLRHAALDVPVDRGGRERRGPGPRPARDGVRVGRGARRHHALRRRAAGRDGGADRRASGPDALAPPAGRHGARGPGGRAGRGHLRGRLPRLQPRDLREGSRDLRPDLRSLQAAADRRLAPRPARGRGRQRQARDKAPAPATARPTSDTGAFAREIFRRRAHPRPALDGIQPLPSLATGGTGTASLRPLGFEAEPGAAAQPLADRGLRPPRSTPQADTAWNWRPAPFRARKPRPPRPRATGPQVWGDRPARHPFRARKPRPASPAPMRRGLLAPSSEKTRGDAPWPSAAD